ncbi:MAG: hypothetical protein ACI9OH_002812 [Oleispira sp.]|jgi:hypothetical protein
MIRNLLASAILLAASASVLAGPLADSLNAEGASSSEVVSAALASCADAACKADVLAEALEAGVDATSVMSLALAANIDVATITAALRSANVSESDIVAAAVANNLSPTAVTQATAGGQTQQTQTNTPSIPVSNVQPGTEPSSISPI